jgi:hypothetical protein
MTTSIHGTVELLSPVSPVCARRALQRIYGKAGQHGQSQQSIAAWIFSVHRCQIALSRHVHTVDRQSRAAAALQAARVLCRGTHPAFAHSGARATRCNAAWNARQPHLHDRGHRRHFRGRHCVWTSSTRKAWVDVCAVCTVRGGLVHDSAPAPKLNGCSANSVRSSRCTMTLLTWGEVCVRYSDSRPVNPR